MTTTTTRPHLQELTAPRPAHGWAAYFDSALLPSHILRSEGFTASGTQSLFDLYEEMEQKDGHLFAVLQTRKNGVLSCSHKVLPASNEPRDLLVARSVEQILRAIPDFEQALAHVLDAFGKGLSVQEILWDVRPGPTPLDRRSPDRQTSEDVHAGITSAVAVRALKSRAPGRFVFAPGGALRLSPWENMITTAAVTSSDVAATTGSPLTTGRPAAVNLPERKFLVFRFNALYDNPYGMGLCARAYWYYWFKKNNLKFWVVFNEKFGAPTVVGKYRPGASDQDRQRLLEVIESLQNDTGVTVPESITLELLEARRSGNVSTYRELADWCNDEISKIVLGATLTAGEGRRGGSRALGEVHERVRNEYIESDARALESAINTQLVRWIVDFNFGPDVPAPRWTIDTTRNDALESEIQIDRQLIEAGVALPERYFYEKYQRPAPIASEPTLRYDDRNLFQYHLQYGILTINEARERLGLSAVPWGDQPPRSQSSPRSPKSDISPVDETSENAGAPRKNAESGESEIEGRDEKIRET